MIEVGDASARILARIHPLAAEVVATREALDRTLAEPVFAAITSPPWDNASMDGYAVRSEDIDASRPPLQLTVIEAIAAGAFPSLPVNAGEATRIMTGAPVPAGADSVIRHEDTDNGTNSVTIMNARDSGKNIRRAGEDFGSGDVLFKAGETLRAAHLGVLASAAVKTVQLHRRPRVAIISSGDELVSLEDFGHAHVDQKIVSSNSVTLAALVHDAGGVAVDLGIARDDRDSLREKFEAARDCDLIVTSAGMSVGDHDHVRDVFDELGGSIDFWKVRMRPGAPLAFGMLGQLPWIGVSGNPVSAIVSFEVFIRPVVRRLSGNRCIFRETVSVTIGSPITIAARLMHFLRVVVTIASDGGYVAELAGSQSSSVLTSIARANALLIVPGDRLTLLAGEVFRAIPLGQSVAESDRLNLS